MKKAYFLGKTCLAVLVLLVLLPWTGNAAGPKAIVGFAKLNGENVVPANNSPGTGLITFQLTRNWDTLFVIGSITGTQTAVTGLQIRTAPKGQNGPVLADLNPFRSGNKVYAALTGATIPPGIISAVLSGNTYVNVATSGRPDGELRGQIRLTDDHSFHGIMDPYQEVGAVGGNGIGLTVIQVSATRTWFELHSVFRNLTGNPIAARLNFGRRGTNGPLAINLTPYLHDGNQIDAKIELEDLPDGLLDSLRNGSVYINIITAAYPDGEIRGQLIATTGLAFYTKGDASQETAKPNSNGVVLGFFEFTAALDSAKFFFIADRLNNNDSLDKAHLHRGPVNVDGPIVVDLVRFIRGNIVAGRLASGSELNKQLLIDLMEGNIYFNGHTVAFPNGEVRGQMKTFIRTAFCFDLCGGQEVPTAKLDAYGAGLVTLAYDSSNLRFIVNVDNLSGPITAAHFHREVQGQNGAIIKNIHFNVRFAEGRWTSQGDTPLTRGLVQDFLEKRIYVNVHTNLYPNGELRGQVVRGAGICASAVGIDEPFAFGASVVAYPVPVNGTLNLTLNGEKAGQIAVSLSDLQGRQVLNSSVNMVPGANKYALDASSLSEGMYILTLTDSQGGRYTQKITKQ